ncbi:hypothetical protein [Leucothrix arctica]|uniref:hypothetical protein n=1 Tax=Leucothrix arctica TaxID=1481894 RepID=UPI001304F05D|nr:hypothetical protein [Leucothrix arctica]
MTYLFSLSGALVILTILAMIFGMGWLAHKMYKLSAKPRVEIVHDDIDDHAPQH